METNEHSVMKIYLSNTDKIGFELLYESLVMRAKRFGISGVTVYRGIMGYGTSSKIDSTRFWELTEKLPVVVEMIDETRMIDIFYKSIENDLDKLGKGCLVTKCPITVKFHKTGNGAKQKN